MAGSEGMNLVGRYVAYGLLFDSEIELPEFLSGPADSDAPVDVTVRHGTVPESLQSFDVGGAAVQANSEHVLVNVANVARFLVSGNSDITVDAHPECTPAEVRVFLLGTVIGTLLQRRGLLVLHAAGLATDAGAVLFCGVSGAGKSTLLGSFLQSEAKMLVDDVCAVRTAPDRVDVLPGYPRTRLWADSAAALAVDTDPLLRTRTGLDKFERQVPEQFAATPMPLRCIYILQNPSGVGERDAADEIRIDEMSGFDAMTAVLAHSYRRRLLVGVSAHSTHLAHATNVVQRASVRSVRRPRSLESLDALKAAIIADLQDLQ